MEIKVKTNEYNYTRTLRELGQAWGKAKASKGHFENNLAVATMEFAIGWAVKVSV